MPDRFAGPARVTPKWIPTVELTWQEKRDLRRGGVPIQYEEVEKTILNFVADREKAALVNFIRAIADDVYTLENPPQGPWWRRALWHMDQTGIRENYVFQGRLRKLANQIEQDIRSTK